jgi:hypothetical protein
VISEDKMNIYNAVASIPKAVVSTIIDQLKILVHNNANTTSREDDEEFNSKEENLLKIITSSK